MLDAKRITGDFLVPYVRNVDVQWDHVNVDDLPEMDIAPDELDRFTLRRGDILICEGGEVGRTAIWNGGIDKCAFQKAIHRLRPLSSAEIPRFLYYCMRFASATDIFVAEGNPNTIPHLTGEKLRLFRFPCPPCAEQTAIASFLDRETAKIDELVAEQRRLIELLKEKRQAVISHAITKGLNPHAPMKPSGIEWLGDVPEHWDVIPLKRIVSLDSGDAIAGENIEDSGEFPVFGGNGVRGYTSSFTHEGSYVVIGRQGALCGNINYANGRFWATEHAVVATPLKLLDVFWLGEMLRSMNLNQYSISAAQPGLSMEMIGNLRTVLAPIDDQMNVSNYLGDATNKIDALTAEAQRAIDLLQERRTALISAAVTGKIDVRGLAESGAA
jgi:type I restriction enzyme S subunit